MCLVRSAAAAMKISGQRDELVAAGVVLAEPGLVVAEPVERDDPLEVVLEGERRVLPDGVERREEDAEAQGPGRWA